MEPWRREAPHSFEAWCRYVLAPLEQEPQPHHLLLIRELQRVADAMASGVSDNVMVMMPPGAGKSAYVSKLFGSWLLATRGRPQIIGVSHTAHLAEQFSKNTRDILAECGPPVSRVGPATMPAHLWETTAGGQYRAIGTGGAVTGFRADCVLMDDPVKGDEAATSQLQRDNVWDWYLTDLSTRLKPGGCTVLVLTRWHEDDIAGRLLLHAPEQWRTLKLPAIAGENDPLGRAPGEWLWDDDPAFKFGELLRVRKRTLEAAGAARVWWSLYQQEPRSPEGLLFKVANISTIDEAPVCTKTVRAWDLAATAATSGDPDWTVGVKLGRRDTGSYVILDVKRMRGGPEDVERAIRDTAAEDGRAVTIGLPQDPGQAGKQQVAYLTRQLAGFTVVSSPETGDKETRAGPVASQVNVGNVAVVRAAWTRALIEELRDFPNGRKDDQADALSRAFSLVATAPEPAKRVHVPLMGR